LPGLPYQPLHHRVHFLHSPKPKKIRTSYRPTFKLKSVISRVANTVNGLDPETCRNEARRAESGGGVLGRCSEPLPISYRVWGSAVSSPAGSGRSPRKLGFWSFLGPNVQSENGVANYEYSAQANLIRCTLVHKRRKI